MKKSALDLFFRIVYASSYAFLHLILVVLLLVTPADIINQCRLRHNFIPIFIVSVCYVAAIIVVILVYSGRLYINRSVLNSIPKSWIPIEKGDVRKSVRKMIAARLSRSAAIALVAQPRHFPESFEILGRGDGPMAAAGGGAGESTGDLKVSKQETVQQEMGIDLPPCRPVWGEIEHFGWAPPDSPETGDLQYSTVLAELPNLIEAKALTLAPPDPMSQTDPPTLDPEAVVLLQRPVYMGLRDYLVHLTQLGVIDLNGEGDGERVMSAVVTSFVSTYEYARFSTQMLSHASFRQLMHDLATILRRMAPLDPALLFDDVDDDSDDDYGDYRANISDDASSRSRNLQPPPGPFNRFAGTDSDSDDIDNNAARSSPTTPRSASRRSSAYQPGRQARQQQANQRQRQRSGTVLRYDDQGVAISRSSSSSSGYTAGSVGSDETSRHIPGRQQYSASPTVATSASALNLPTGQTFLNPLKPPKTPKTPKNQTLRQADAVSISSSSSANTFAQSRRPYHHLLQRGSNSSLQSAASSGSVIRLSGRGDSTDLPYVLQPSTPPMVHDGT